MKKNTKKQVRRARFAKGIALVQSLIFVISLFVFAWGTNEHPNFWWGVGVSVLGLAANLFVAWFLEDLLVPPARRERTR